MTTKFDIGDEVVYFTGVNQIAHGKVQAIHVEATPNVGNGVSIKYFFANKEWSFENSMAYTESQLWRSLAELYEEKAKIAEEHENEQNDIS